MPGTRGRPSVSCWRWSPNCDTLLYMELKHIKANPGHGRTRVLPIKEAPGGHSPSQEVLIAAKSGAKQKIVSSCRVPASKVPHDRSACSSSGDYRILPIRKCIPEVTARLPLWIHTLSDCYGIHRWFLSQFVILVKHTFSPEQSAQETGRATFYLIFKHGG